MEADNSETTTAQVSENKFNGSATLDITVDDGTDKRTVKQVAERFFKETHGTRPSKVVAEKDETSSMFAEKDEWTVMVADHSSGSLVDSAEYTF